jgi:hypothetical protein
MDVSGKPHEGWMTLVPLVVLVGIVMIALGGPVEFMNTVTGWMGDAGEYLHRLLKSL